MRRGAIKAARIAFSLAIWGLLLWFLARALGDLPPPEAWRGYLNASTLSAIAIFAAGFALATALRTLRFGLLVRSSAAIRWRDLALGFPWLFFLGAITPFRLGEGVRAVWVARRGGSMSEAVGLWFGERFSDLLMLALFFAFGLLLAPRPQALTNTVMLAMIAAIAIGYLLLWAFQTRLAATVRAMPLIPAAAGDVIASFRYMRDTRMHCVIGGLTLAIWLVMAGTFWATIALLIGAAPAGMALAALGAVNFAALLSASPGNVGSFQAAMVAVLLLYGRSAEEAFISAVIIQTTGLAVTCVLGLGARGLSACLQTRGRVPEA